MADSKMAAQIKSFLSGGNIFRDNCMWEIGVKLCSTLDKSLPRNLNDFIKTRG